MDTNNKIKKLTDKIYLEGVEKAQKEAELIIAKAKEEADSIIYAAKIKKEQIEEKSKKQADELKATTDAEIRLAAQQFISNFKQQLTKLITHKQVEAPVKKAYNDKKFLQNIMLTIIKNWQPNSHNGVNISLQLPGRDEKDLNEFFNGKLEELLNAGIEINFIPTIKNGFKIGPKDNSYHISFTDNDFVNYFKNHLKEKTKNLIFD